MRYFRERHPVPGGVRAPHALLASSSPISEEEDSELTENLIRVAARGRETGSQLERDGEPVALIHWGAQLLDAIAPVCEPTDGNDPDRPYSSALAEQRVKLEDPSATPSARVLREMRDHGETFFFHGCAGRRQCAKQVLMTHLTRRSNLPCKREQWSRLANKSASSHPDDDWV